MFLWWLYYCENTTDSNFIWTYSLHFFPLVHFVLHVSHLSCGIEDLKVHSFTPNSQLMSVDGLCYKEWCTRYSSLYSWALGYNGVENKFTWLCSVFIQITVMYNWNTTLQHGHILLIGYTAYSILIGYILHKVYCNQDHLHSSPNYWISMPSND